MDPEDCQSTRKGLLAPEEDATHVEIHVHAAASGIELRAHQPAVLKSYAWFANTVAQELDVPVLLSEGEDEPHKTRKTLLKSAFSHSKHRVQYEMRTYFWVLNLGRITESTKDTYLEYIQRNLPEGVAMKVTTREMRSLPETIREHMDSANEKMDSQS